jgi:hypothetical protein
MPKTFRFFVAGVQFHDLDLCIKDIKVDGKLVLNPEPDNKYDPNAIAIHYNDGPIPTMVGYVPKKLAPDVGALMLTSDNVTCKVFEVTPKSKPWERLSVTIEGGE